MAQPSPNREPTREELRALALNARQTAVELRLASKELVARIVERRLADRERRLSR